MGDERGLIATELGRVESRKNELIAMRLVSVGVFDVFRDEIEELAARERQLRAQLAEHAACDSARGVDR